MAGKFQFIMRSGPTPGANYPLEAEMISIGRDASNTIQINDAEMSRRHARLQFQGGKYIIEDLGSTNGTNVNGQRLSAPYILRPGDVVSFGEQIVLAFEASDFDPGATLASPRSAGAPRQQPVATPPPPPQSYAGSVTSGPLPPVAARNNMPIIAGAIILLCLCAVGAFLFFAPTSFWCLFPVWPAGYCP